MEFLPDIAAGDLTHRSVAEVVAAAFRANATGTIVFDHEGGESRIFVRYGSPCGVKLARGALSFVDFLAIHALVDPEAGEQAAQTARRTGQRMGEVLAQQGLIDPDQLPVLVASQHSQNLVALCQIRDGRYELRGWERPPAWTDPVALCPLRAIVSALQSDELFDRRRALADALGPRTLQPAPDVEDLATRLALDPAEHQLLTAGPWPCRADEAGAGLLDPDNAESVIVALTLLGLLEPQGHPLRLPDPPSAPRPTRTEKTPLFIPVDPLAEMDPIALDGDDDPSADDDAPPDWLQAPSVDDFSVTEGDLLVDALLLHTGKLQTDDAPPREPTLPPPTPPPTWGAPADLRTPPPLSSEFQTDLQRLLLDEIADELKDLQDEPTGPLVFDVPELTPSLSGDALALQVAQEEAFAEFGDGLSFDDDEAALAAALHEPAHDETDDTLALQFASDTASDEPLIAPADEPEPDFTVPVPTSETGTGPMLTGRTLTDQHSRTTASHDVRRKLLQRALRNVSGNVFAREQTSRIGVAEPSEPAPRPADADAQLERDVQGLLQRMAGDDHFARLGLGRDASTEDVKEAFLSLAKRYHPDRVAAAGQAHLLPQVRELFSRVKEAYDVLVDPASRARHAAAMQARDSGRPALSPDEARAAYQKALAHLRRRDLKNAEAELVRAIDGDAQPAYLAELAHTLFINPQRRAEAMDEIRDLVQRALKSNEPNDRAYIVAAMLARADDQTGKVERYFRKALEVNPKNVDAARELRLIEMRRAAAPKKSGSLLDRLRGR